MQGYSEKAAQALGAFYKATGVGALCLDTQLNVVAYCPSKKVAEDFVCLGMHRIGAFLAEQFSGAPESEHGVQTYFLENNLVCNIALLFEDARVLGAFVTQPVLVRKSAPVETDAPARGSDALTEALKRAPSVAYGRIMPMGRILSSLALTLPRGYEFRQRLCGGSGGMAKDLPVPGAISVHPYPAQAVPGQAPYSLYREFQKHIRRGDTRAVLERMNGLNAGSVPMDRLDREDFIRSLKNSFIKACSMGSYAAIDAGAPYSKTTALADAYIRQAETLENINDIYELMKKAMLSFAQAVAVKRMIAHSKPVRQAVEYIELNYGEKITLAVLAQHVGLSETYLSNLIKKETGLTLSENINKVRIEAGKKLLLDTNQGILDIARKAGFSYQNHFAAVFKKFTGLSPLEFRRTFGRAFDEDAGGSLPQGLPYTTVEPLMNVLESFPEIFDIARVVNPISHRAWNLAPDLPAQPLSDEEPPCHHFWGRNESCENCVSKTAFIQNRVRMKLDRRGERIYLVMAIPRSAGGRPYVVEILKDVTDCLSAEAAGNFAGDAIKSPGLTGASAPDPASGLMTRETIEKALPARIRQSKMQDQPLSIILCRVESLCAASPDTPSDAQLKAFAEVLSGLLLPPESWAGRYAGNLFLICLPGVCREGADELAGNIEGVFGSLTRSGNGLAVRVCCSAQSLDGRLESAEDLVNPALAELQADG